MICLADSLRPDLSISREKLRYLPWRVYSAAALAMCRALNAEGITRYDLEYATFQGSALPRQTALREILEDNSLYPDGDWANLPIFSTSEGLLSLRDIRALTGRGAVEIYDLPAPWVHPLDHFTAALIQVGLKFSVKPHKDFERTRLLVMEGDPAPITEGHKLFRPLMFLPFVGSTHFRLENTPWVNINHPFAAWLLDSAPEIARRYPGLFERLQSEIGRPWIWEEERSQGLEILNATLDRLRELHPSVRPPRDLILTREDIFGQEP